MPERRTDAAAVPDAVDDTLRDEMARTIAASLHGGRWIDMTPRKIADALLPLIRDHIAAAVQAERERIAQAIDEATPHMTVIGAHGMQIAARIARVDPEQVDTP